LLQGRGDDIFTLNLRTSKRHLAKTILILNAGNSMLLSVLRKG
jgi:hypothetical protein